MQPCCGGERVGQRAVTRLAAMLPAGPCEAKLEAEAADRRIATLTYDGAELMVELVAEEELQAAFTAGGGKIPGASHALIGVEYLPGVSPGLVAMVSWRVASWHWHRQCNAVAQCYHALVTTVICAPA